MKKIHFIGDSLIAFFDWQSFFPSCHVINSGIAGETVSGLFSRIKRLSPQSQDPDWIVVMIGTNNLAMQDFSFIPDYEKIVTALQITLPTSKILIHGLFPISLPFLADNTVSTVNEMIQTLAQEKKVGYLDGCKVFANTNKNVRYFLEDGVHLSDYGYTLWANAVEQYL